MKIRIYQIDLDRDVKRVAFESLERLERYQGSSEVNSSLYDMVYEKEVDCKGLEDVFRVFNLNHPKDYCARSLSVSDVVEVVESNQDAGSPEPGFYFCDSVGFEKIPFAPELTHKKEYNTIQVVFVEPGKLAQITNINAEFKRMQQFVGGGLHTYEPFNDNACIVYNENGIFFGEQLNRAVREEPKIREMSYAEMKECFYSAENERRGRHLDGFIVFTADSFTKPYSEESRTYRVSSNNKAFQPGMGGYSIFASAIDGSDPLVRLEQYMAAEKGGRDGWKIERCYMKEPGDIREVISGPFFICGTKGEEFVGLTDEQAKKYLEMFRLPEHIRVENSHVEATPYEPKAKALEQER